MITLKKLATVSTLALALVLGLVIFGGQRTHAAGDWYVSTTGDDGNNCATPATACLTLARAILSASAGDTINVEAGTYPYTGVVNVNKTLTLKGAQAGNDARSRFGEAESVLENSGGLYVTANDVIIDGFTVQQSTSSAFTGYGIALGAGTAGADVINNIIQNNIIGLGLANKPAVPGTQQALIRHNSFRNNTLPGAASGHHIYTDQYVAGEGGVKDVLIDSNDFENDDVPTTASFGIGISNTGILPFTGIQIQYNRFDSVSPNSRGMYFFGTQSSSIKANSIRNKTNYAIRFLGGNSNITIECNSILQSNRGVHVSSGVNSSITVNNNNIAGNATAGLEVASGTYSGGPGSLNAENNWWGSNIGPTTPTGPDDPANPVVDPDGVVDYVPFRTQAINDSDEDGILDPCDVECPEGDSDGDGVADCIDNCDNAVNPGQEDTDEDGVGDACDNCTGQNQTDSDGDGVADCIDNCDNAVNPGQQDTDEDGVGDACDNCTGQNPGQEDSDGDGHPDGCDNCPTVANPNQADFDLDAIGDACDQETGPPQNKDQCKNGGWRLFDQPRTFKNEGDCVQYVNTGDPDNNTQNPDAGNDP